MALVAALATLSCRSGDTPSPGLHATERAKVGAGTRPLFVRGPTGGAAVAPFVATELQRGQRGHYGVLVYVGATWCEPCQKFHQAVADGELDETLSGVHMVEFDLDADREPLSAAGYSSELIPLFALPKADGTASDNRIEGSVKGADAVRLNLMPRLRAFLQGQAAG